MSITSPRQSKIGFPLAKLDHPNEEEHRREIARIANLAINGKLNTITTLTLTAGATSTTLTNAYIGKNSGIFLIPTTSNAAGALATTYQTYPNTTTGAAVINHANTGTTDRIFAVAILG